MSTNQTRRDAHKNQRATRKTALPGSTVRYLVNREARHIRHGDHDAKREDDERRREPVTPEALNVLEHRNRVGAAKEKMQDPHIHDIVQIAKQTCVFITTSIDVGTRTAEETEETPAVAINSLGII